MLTERLQFHARLAAARIVLGFDRFGCDLFLGGAGMAGPDPLPTMEMKRRAAARSLAYPAMAYLAPHRIAPQHQ